MGIFDILSTTIGVDPGSKNLRIIKDGGIIFNEPSVISVDTTSEEVSGFGNSIVHKKNHKIIQPVKNVIRDFHGFEELLRRANKKALNETSFFVKAKVVYFSIPTTTSESEKRNYRDAAEHAHAKEVHMAHQACTAALGMDILFNKKDFILIDFSASKIEITVFANALIISDGIVHAGTWKLKRIIRNYLFRNYHIEPTEEELQTILTSFGQYQEKASFEVQKKEIEVAGLLEKFEMHFQLIEEEFLETFERISGHPHLTRILSNGFFFTGGGSTINWIVQRIIFKSKVNYTVSRSPFLDNINGLALMMKNLKKFEPYMMT